MSWALRLIGRRNRKLNAATVALAERLTGSEDPAARWIGKEVLKDLGRRAVMRRLKMKSGRDSK